MTFRSDVPDPPVPTGWADDGGSWRCLGCRRAEAVEATQGGPEGGRAAARRRALTEFELRRDPEAPDNLIARRAGCQTRFVAPLRAALNEAGTLPPVPTPGARR